MKRLLLILLALTPFVGIAQYKYYTDSSYNQTFSFLTSSTSVNNNQFWDDPEFAIPLGFSFHLFNDTTDTIHISSELGYGAFITTDSFTSSSNSATGIIAHGSDLQDFDTSENSSFSPISYSLSGVSPSRIFKLEWKNAGFYNAIDDSTYTDTLNLQLWLYEGSDIIEMRFGNGNYTSNNVLLYDGGPGPWVGLFDSADINFDTRICYFLTDSVNTPQLDSAASPYSLPLPPGMIGNPAAGSVYQFKPVKNGGTVGYSTLKKTISHEINYFTDRNELRIDVFNDDRFQYTIQDIQGKVIARGKVEKGRKIIETQLLSKGMYIVNLHSGKENTSFKFVR